jgi:hypothetical protein
LKWEREKVVIIVRTSSTFPPRNEVWGVEFIVANCKQVHLKLGCQPAETCWHSPYAIANYLCVRIGAGPASRVETRWAACPLRPTRGQGEPCGARNPFFPSSTKAPLDTLRWSIRVWQCDLAYLESDGKCVFSFSEF